MKVSLKELSVYLGIPQDELLDVAKTAGRHYRDFSLITARDKHGLPAKVRHIDTPMPRLRKIQGRIQAKLLAKLQYPACLHGSIKGRSPATNAAAHRGQKVVVGIDIEDFFPSVSHHAVYQVWCRLGYSPRLARMLTRLTTRNRRLPQGAPTSSLLSNLVLLDVDAQVEQLCGEYDCRYTRYVDDMTLSGNAVRSLIPEVMLIIQRAGFKAKRRKTKVAAGHRVAQSVTGININDPRKLSIPRSWRQRFRRQIRELNSPENRNELDSIRGKLGYLEQFNTGEARRLRNVLEQRMKLTEHRLTRAARNSLS